MIRPSAVPWPEPSPTLTGAQPYPDRSPVLPGPDPSCTLTEAQRYPDRSPAVPRPESSRTLTGSQPYSDQGQPYQLITVSVVAFQLFYRTEIFWYIYRFNRNRLPRVVFKTKLSVTTFSKILKNKYFFFSDI